MVPPAFKDDIDIVITCPLLSALVMDPPLTDTVKNPGLPELPLGGDHPAGISTRRVPFTHAVEPAVYVITMVLPEDPPTAIRGLITAEPSPYGVEVAIGLSVNVGLIEDVGVTE